MRLVVIALITSSIPFEVMYLDMLIKIELKRKKRENERYCQNYNNNNGLKCEVGLHFLPFFEKKISFFSVLQLSANYKKFSM